MAVDVSEFLVQPGFLAFGSTDLSTAFPHGGSDLGASETGVRLVTKLGRFILKSEESGERILDTIYTDAELMLFVTLHQWNDVNLARAFPGGLTAAGASSGKKVVQFPGTLKPGTKGSANSGVLVFSPLDLTNNKVVLVRKAAPMLAETAELNLKLKSPTTLSLVFYCLEDTSIGSSNARYPSRVLAIGDRDDLTI